MTASPTLLAVLLEERGLDRYGSFRAAYQKAACALDPRMDDNAPSRAQFHRWITGGLRGLPYTDHCRVLEQLLNGYTATQLLQPCPDRRIPVPARTGSSAADSMPTDPGTADLAVANMADVSAVFTSRSEFAAKIQPLALLTGADRIRSAGLSLNLICQQLPDTYLQQLLSDGAHLSCLFLDPDGQGIQAREREEQHMPGTLSTLTRLNIGMMTRLRDRLPTEARERLHVAVYDETVRFNIIIAGDTCVVQPYLPQARGIDSPTLLICNTGTPGGLYPMFEHVYEAIASRSKPI